MNEELEMLEMEDLGEYEDMEDYEELEDFEEFEDFEDFEEFEDFEDWERPSTRTRPSRGPITLPPIVIRVRPSVILTQFAFNKDTLSPQHVNQIKEVARRVASSWTRRPTPGRPRRPIRTIRLVGHTDNRGSASYNKTLGMRRAQAVRARLVAELNRLRPGLAARLQIIPQSVGELRPMASNATAAGRARNRRVAIYLSSDR